MDKEKNITIRMDEDLYAFIISSGMNKDYKLVYRFLEFLMVLGKDIMYQDMKSVDNRVINMLQDLTNSNVILTMEYFKRIVTEHSMKILDVLVVYNLLDNMCYISDYNANKIVLRAYKINNINHNEGIRDEF